MVCKPMLSFRFERGADINITVYALKRAAFLIQEITGGEIASGIVDIYPYPKDPTRVFLSFMHLDRLIGKSLTEKLSTRSLRPLVLKF